MSTPNQQDDTGGTQSPEQSPMATLVNSLGDAHLSGRGKMMRRTPPRGRVAMKMSGRLPLEELPANRAVSRNGAESPVQQLQFSLSPAAVRQAPPLVSPTPKNNESDSEVNSSRSSGAEFSSSDSTLDQDEFVAQLTFADSHPVVPMVAATGTTRRHLSMSANTYRASPPVEAAAVEAVPAVKKSLFAAIQEDEEEEVVAEVAQPFRWERSASMIDLPFAAPGPSRGLRQSPPPLSGRLSSVPTVVPTARLPSSVSPNPSPTPSPRATPSPRPSALGPRSMSGLMLPPVREVQRPAEQRLDPMRRRGSAALPTISPRPLSSSAEQTREDNEKKRLREGMPAPSIPDLRKSSYDAAGVAPFLPSLAHEFRLALPLVPNLKHDGVNTISCATVRDILMGTYVSQFRSIYILDCRFDYEFEGGHIRGALHANDPAVLVERFFKHRAEGPACFIFHCEFSSKRGPSQLKLMRELDRKANQEAYPHLFYPELYLMENGYCEFFRLFPNLCDPHEYIRMDDQRFRERLRDNLVMRNQKKKRRPSTADETLE